MIFRCCSNLPSSYCSLLWNILNYENNTPLFYLPLFISFFPCWRILLCLAISYAEVVPYLYHQSPSSLAYKITSVTDTREMSKAKRPRQWSDFNPPLPRNYTPQCKGVAEEEMHLAGTFSWAYCADKSSWVWIWLPRPSGHSKSFKYSLAQVLWGSYRKWFSGPNLIREVPLSCPFYDAS